MVIDTAAVHGLQGFFHHGKGFFITGPVPVAEEEEEVVGGGKLGHRAETAVSFIIVFLEGTVGFLQGILPQFSPVQILGLGLEGFCHLLTGYRSSRFLSIAMDRRQDNSRRRTYSPE